MYRISALLMTLLLMSVSTAQASTNRIYMSPMETSKWVMTSDSPIVCEIEHYIPRFGKVVFSQYGGRQLQLRVETHHPFKKDLDVSFRSVTASWKGIHLESELAALKSTGGHDLVNIDSNTARHAYFRILGRLTALGMITGRGVPHRWVA